MASFAGGRTSSTGWTGRGRAVATAVGADMGNLLVLRGSVPGWTPGAEESSDEAGRADPGVAGVRGVVAGDGRLDEAVGPVGGDEDLAVVLQPGGREGIEEVVRVGCREPHLGHLWVRLEDGPAHGVQCLLDGPAVGGGERLEEQLQDAVV